VERVCSLSQFASTEDDLAVDTAHARVVDQTAFLPPALSWHATQSPPRRRFAPLLTRKRGGVRPLLVDAVQLGSDLQWLPTRIKVAPPQLYATG
jgi:hypothetical protein